MIILFLPTTLFQELGPPPFIFHALIINSINYVHDRNHLAKIHCGQNGEWSVEPFLWMPCSRMQTNHLKKYRQKKNVLFFLPQNFFSPLDGWTSQNSRNSDNSHATEHATASSTVKMNIVILKEALSSWMMIRHCFRVILILLFWGICVHSWDPVLRFLFLFLNTRSIPMEHSN